MLSEISMHSWNSLHSQDLSVTNQFYIISGIVLVKIDMDPGATGAGKLDINTSASLNITEWV